MSRIFWDTNIFIYLFEDYGEFSKVAAGLRTRMLARVDQLLTSTLTLGEILVKPMEEGDLELCGKYEEAIARTSLMVPLDAKAQRFALHSDVIVHFALRMQSKLACAAAAAVDLFITNDGRLQGKQVAVFTSSSLLNRCLSRIIRSCCDGLACPA